MNSDRTARRGGTTLTVSFLAAGALVVGASALLVRGVGSSDGGPGGQDRFVVARGSFEISIPAAGELTALKETEIRNRYDYRAVITEIAKEGATVRKGEVLFRLSDQEIRNKIKDAEDEVNSAQIALVAAQSDLAIRQSTADSEVDKADLQVMLARLALKAWEDGEDVSKRKELALELETAEINYNRLVDRYEQSRQLVEKQFISEDEFKRDEIAMIEARARLDQAKLDAEIYEKYVYEQDLATKTSDVEQAEAELERVRERCRVELETAQAEVASKSHQLQSRQERLAEFQEQLSYCTVTAPEDGWVVYASSLQSGGRWWRNDGQPPTVGTELQRNDLVIVLPDTTQMVAAVKVNESLSGLIQPGQRASITYDAMRDVVLRGTVTSIGVLAESGGWIDRNRRDYTVKIAIEGANDLGLKPSMRCKADVYVGRVDDTLFVPVQAVFREGPASYVYVPQGSGYAQREVNLGKSSELYVQVLGGLDENDVVLLRQPGPQEVTARLEKKDDPERGERSFWARGAE